MKANRSTLGLFLSAALFCCVGLIEARAAAQETPPTQTREVCDSAYEGCFGEYGFFGLFICSGQYAQCLAQIAGPAEPNETVAKLTTCREEAATCRTEAGEDQEKLAACTQKQRECTGGALGVDPDASNQARACFETAQTCFQSAEGNEAYGQCVSDLQACLAPEGEPNPG